ncbi:putative ABC transport system permease protein [Nitrosomonas cryotolerans]|uniref:Putative ABC transport system permease protein n=1 Tax=Nitrosomonas cryotolerans ATCC 49181 TaxID=1131553 RepID=A0A1N6I1C8_9PROT|nr:FtsX-like permease family protein [Nitrosomonas cryotolerans]SFP58552.1 putative ABC transport system permease protein [Nitrosomonas cryotolerans]SIO25854.1 putative ABC transport system permease protein [Nitrosomonas cryotolerans ATCC 49181]
MNFFKLSFLMLHRDWRAGELHILILALVIAVGGMTTVSFFSDRVARALSHESNQLLGADLLVISNHPLPVDYADEAERLGLAVSNITKFPSMISNGESNQLANIKAVTEGYPLRGRLYLADGAEFIGSQQNSRVANAIPVPGTIWIDEKLMTSLALKRGDKVDVGALQLTVAELILREPDHSIGFINMGSRVLINAADLPATGLIQPGSRIAYHLLIAGEAGVVEQYRDWARPLLTATQRIEGIRDARPEIKAALDRAEKFLSLSALASVILAATAIALAVRRFTLRHLDGCAVMRSLGASQTGLLYLYLCYFLVLGIVASTLGCLLGFASQEILATWLSGLTETGLPWPGWMPAIHGLLIGIVLLLGFALPPILNLRSVSALRVLRRDIGVPNMQSLTGYVLGIIILSLLLIWQAGDLRLGFYIIGGFIASIAIFGLFGFLLIKCLSGLRHQSGSAWRYGLASIRRRAVSSVVQAVALGLGLMALLILTMIQDDMVQEWHANLPPDSPNRFLVNIQTDQLQPLEEFFDQYDIDQPIVFPMVRGRLIEINGKKISSADYANPHAANHIRREFNLSWTDTLRDDNQIVAGSWWNKEDDGTEAVISIEDGIAKTLGIRLDDQLTYDIAGSHFSAKVISLRKIEWDTFRVNFFVVTPPGLLEQYPVSYITSFYLPPSQEIMMHELVRAFPNLLVVDVAAVVGQVQKMIAQVSQAIGFVFLFTLLAGLIVLYAAIASTQDERIYEAAIFRTLGARRDQLMRAWAAEFAILGGLSGLFAAAGASVLGYLIGHYVLHLTYTFNPWIWFIGFLTGVLGVVMAGLMGTRATLSESPLLTLRKTG